MNVLDENVDWGQRELLEGWRIRTRKIRADLGWEGMDDTDVIPLLVQLT